MLYHKAFTLLAFGATVLATAVEDETQLNLDAAGNPAYGSMSPPPAANTAAAANSEDDAPSCLSPADAAIVGRDFGLLISNYTTELADRLLADDFIDQADSVNTLINTSPLPHQALGSLTFDSKKAFMAGQGAQPPVPFDILNTWSTCDTTIIRWRSHQKPDHVQGVSIAVVQPAKEGEGGGVGETRKWQIKAIYAEFNSGAWLNNLGNPQCGERDWEKKGWEVEVEK